MIRDSDLLGRTEAQSDGLGTILSKTVRFSREATSPQLVEDIEILLGFEPLEDIPATVVGPFANVVLDELGDEMLDGDGLHGAAAAAPVAATSWGGVTEPALKRVRRLRSRPYFLVR